MIAEPQAIAAQLGNAVFERIAKDGLLNRELIVDALYRELLVIIAEGPAPRPAPDFTSAEKRIVAWLDSAPAPEVGGIEVVRDPYLKAAQLAKAIHARTDPTAELYELVATAMGGAYGTMLRVGGTEHAWLAAARTLVDLYVSRATPPDTWPQHVRRVFFDALEERAKTYSAVLPHVKQRWNDAVQAGVSAYRKRVDG